jgi:hypothetical protein
LERDVIDADGQRLIRPIFKVQNCRNLFPWLLSFMHGKLNKVFRILFALNNPTARVIGLRAYSINRSKLSLNALTRTTR